MAAADTVSSITVGGTEILGSTVTFDTDVATTCKAAIRKINAYSSPYWATFEGTDIIYIFPRNGLAQDTGAVVTTESGFTATDVDMNSSVAFVAAKRWPSLNLGDDILTDTAMYAVGFSFTGLYSTDTAFDATKAKGVEIDLQTQDQTLDVYIGPEGKRTLSATPADNTHRTFSVLAVAQGQIGMFLQSGAAQNPTFDLRAW